MNFIKCGRETTGCTYPGNNFGLVGHNLCLHACYSMKYQFI